MPQSLGPEPTSRAGGQLSAALGWTAVGVIFAAPLVCESLAQESDGRLESSAVLVLLSLVVAAAAFFTLAIFWRRIVLSIGNRGLATIASIAALQFAVSYAAQIAGYVAGAFLGPFYVFIDGLGSKGLSCLFIGVLVTLLPRPGALALALLTVFTLNAITSGQIGILAVVFIAISVALHEGLAAVLGVTTGRGPRSAVDAADWSFVIRVGIAIGLANALAMYAQYALYELLLRLYFDKWYKLSVAVVTGLVFGGVGAGCGALIGLRLRRTAP
jgi:hypothetical protein